MSVVTAVPRTKTHINLSAATLAAMTLQQGEGIKAANGALAVTTGNRTGRSPKDRFIVRDAVTEHTVDWNSINQPIAPDFFDALWEKTLAHLATLDESFISWQTVGAEAPYSLTVKVITSLAWHSLFTHHLFIQPEHPMDKDQPGQWTLLCVPSFKPKGPADGVNGDAAVILNFSKRAILIIGTLYAGEMKKAMFSVMNFLMPEKNVLPMHCAANVGKDGRVALFFGLSGTGKTTLSADPDRFLIGDDEHGWSSKGIFNFEGGCYAKCIDLSKEREPVIWNAIRETAVMENVILDSDGNPDFKDASLTENTRAAYPLEHIPLRVKENRAGLPQAVIFLTCDLHGVLPPAARLSREQAAWYFLSGYTALVGSTEVGSSKGIQETFSTCFGAPFFPRPAQVYADLLMHHLSESGADVWLVNTGWTGGSQEGGGHRFPIPVTRAIVSAIVNGTLSSTPCRMVPGFHFSIPESIPGVPQNLLFPRDNWQDPAAYDARARLLIEKFINNFKKFKVSEAIRRAGPTLE